MKKLYFLPILFLTSSLFAWDITVADGVATCIECESYDVVNSTTGQVVKTVVLSSAPKIAFDDLVKTGFKAYSSTKWKAEIEKRLKAGYAAPISQDKQIESLWKIILEKEDAESIAIKTEIDTSLSK